MADKNTAQRLDESREQRVHMGSYRVDENNMHSNDTSHSKLTSSIKNSACHSPMPPFGAVLQQTAADFSDYSTLIQSDYSRNGNRQEDMVRLSPLHGKDFF